MAEGHKAEKGKPKEKKGGSGFDQILIELLPVIAILVVIYFVYTTFQAGGGSVFNEGRFGAVLESIHDVWTAISTILTMVFIGIGIYSWIKHSEHASHVEHEIKHRFKHAKEHGEIHKGEGSVGESWRRIDGYVRSENPSDWKIAILEADNLLEEVITRMGFEGENFGEKLKAIKPAQFPYLDHAWEAHKFRNDIAHSTDRPLAHSEASRIIGLYERVFRELKVL